jgi:hypothetical protein
MVCKTRNYWGFGLCPSSGILNTREHNVSEIGPVSILRWQWLRLALSKGPNWIRVGFEVFTAVIMKTIIFWDVTPCSLLRCNRRFGGTYRLHLQGRRKFQQEPASKQVASRNLNTLHGVTSQKMILWVGVYQPSPEDGNRSCFRNVVFSSV